MVVKNNPDKFPEGYVRLRGCGKRKLCRIFYVKRIVITIVFQKNMCNFAGLMLYILDFMVRCKVAYLTFYMAIFSAINFVMSFNLLTHTYNQQLIFLNCFRGNHSLPPYSHVKFFHQKYE